MRTSSMFSGVNNYVRTPSGYRVLVVLSPVNYVRSTAPILRALTSTRAVYILPTSHHSTIINQSSRHINLQKSSSLLQPVQNVTPSTSLQTHLSHRARSRHWYTIPHPQRLRYVRPLTPGVIFPRIRSLLRNERQRDVLWDHENTGLW